VAVKANTFKRIDDNLRVGAFLDQPSYEGRMLFVRGNHKRRGAIVPNLIYVCIELLDQALYDIRCLKSL
jgi:hypothetical protein